MFSTLSMTKIIILSKLNQSSAKPLYLVQSKHLLFGNELKAKVFTKQQNFSQVQTESVSRQ